MSSPSWTKEIPNAEWARKHALNYLSVLRGDIDPKDLALSRATLDCYWEVLTKEELVEAIQLVVLTHRNISLRNSTEPRQLHMVPIEKIQ